MIRILMFVLVLSFIGCSSKSKYEGLWFLEQVEFHGMKVNSLISNNLMIISDEQLVPFRLRNRNYGFKSGFDYYRKDEVDYFVLFNKEGFVRDTFAAALFVDDCTYLVFENSKFKLYFSDINPLDENDESNICW